MFKNHQDSYAVRGCFIGLLIMIVTWVFPLPVAAVYYLLNIDHPFGDVMLMCIPLFLSIPLVGAIVGSLIRRT
jgi:hypothetical protein